MSNWRAGVTYNAPGFGTTNVALIQQTALDQLRASLATAQADAALWQGKYAELRELVLLVEDLAEDPHLGTLTALIDAFNAFRALVEGGTPRTWLVGAPGAAGAGEAPRQECIDEWEAPRVDQDAGEGAPWV